MSSNLILAFLMTQVTLVPILGIILLGMVREREAKDRQIRELMKALMIVGISKGRR